jgi:hypothetical protein
MQVHSIISNTISEEILESGHLSIRLRTDGFSLLLEDNSFKPVVLNNFSNDPPLSLTGHIAACEEWLINHTLMDHFRGEITIVYDTPAATMVPESLFSEDLTRVYLEKTNTLLADESTVYRKVKNRPYYMVFMVPNILKAFARKFQSTCKIMHPSECMLSMADQVDASDHQRGFVLLEIQESVLEILAIQNDMMLLSNRHRLKSGEDILYHSLNTMVQLKLDRSKIPVFVAGIRDEDDELIQKLQKYIRHVKALPYYIREIDKSAIPGNILLAESSRCE